MASGPEAPRDPTDPGIPIKVGPGDMVLDRYRVVEQIASGGHSVVFRGTDERLSRPVCIKLFSGLGGKRSPNGPGARSPWRINRARWDSRASYEVIFWPTIAGTSTSITGQPRVSRRPGSR